MLENMSVETQLRQVALDRAVSLANRRASTVLGGDGELSTQTEVLEMAEAFYQFMVSKNGK